MYIPLKELPEKLQEKIISCLNNNDFPAAKQLRDQYAQAISKEATQNQNVNIDNTVDHANECALSFE